VKCEKHDWDWDISDPTGCPVCYGVSLERERIIKLLENQLAEQKVGMFYADAIRASILIIEGENK
jgi:hypothetical protein